jgi:tetratricopeptide (TPR) repeat protein
MTSSEPDDADALFAMASRKDDDGDVVGALALLEEGTLRFPWYARIWALRGHLLFHAGRYSEAKLSFDRAIDIRPVFPFTLFMRGRAREEQEHLPDAAVDYLACIACQPDKADSYIALIRVLIACKEARSAKNFVERAAKLEMTETERDQLARSRHAIDALEREMKMASE